MSTRFVQRRDEMMANFQWFHIVMFIKWNVSRSMAIVLVMCIVVHSVIPIIMWTQIRFRGHGGLVIAVVMRKVMSNRMCYRMGNGMMMEMVRVLMRMEMDHSPSIRIQMDRWFGFLIFSDSRH